MQETISAILAKAQPELAALKTRADFEAAKARYVGPNGEFTALMKQMGTVPKEQRPAMGKLVNEAKAQLQAQLEATLQRIADAEISAQLGPAIDPTLPVPDPGPGTSHPLTLVREEMCRILRKVGFTVADGPEVETEYYCFDALNTPSDHPARDEKDTFYFPESARFGNVSKKTPEEKYLLRTHTSSVQIRTMLKGSPPIRIVSPGRVYRRDTTDATHSANFHQLECLVVDRGITFAHLAGTIDRFTKAYFGSGWTSRLRPSYFPFTEPSAEFDIQRPDGTWLELGGCGMVHPNVLANCGIDPEEFSGFAFGFGLDRLAATRHGVTDLRELASTDIRFLEQF